MRLWRHGRTVDRQVVACKHDVPLGEHRWITVVPSEEPVDMGPVTTAVLDGTCGNLIRIAAYT